jgi:hypothetical protein
MAGRNRQSDYARGKDRADLPTSRGICFAHDDPCGADQFRQARRSDPHRAVGGAGGRKHHGERLERHVAIDRQRALRAVPPVTSRKTASPTSSDSVLAICAGATP